VASENTKEARFVYEPVCWTDKLTLEWRHHIPELLEGQPLLGFCKPEEATVKLVRFGVHLRLSSSSPDKLKLKL